MRIYERAFTNVRYERTVLVSRRPAPRNFFIGGLTSLYIWKEMALGNRESLSFWQLKSEYSLEE